MIHMFLFHLQMSQFYNSPPPLSNPSLLSILPIWYKAFFFLGCDRRGGGKPHYYNILRTNHHVTK